MRASGRQTGTRYAQPPLVGGSNAPVDPGVLNLLLLLSPTRSPGFLLVYNVVALIVTNANGYPWNTLWTFGHRGGQDARRVGPFAAQGIPNVAVGRLPRFFVFRKARR